MHTVYGGAHLFKADAAQKLGAVALRALHEHAPDAGGARRGDRPRSRARGPHLPARRRQARRASRSRISASTSRTGSATGRITRRTATRRLRRTRSPRGLRDGTLPPSIGIRIKPLSEELKRRSLRTFDLFLTRLLDRSDGVLPPNFVVTLPKITAPEQVAALASACDAFEYWRGLPAGALRIELMVETTQSIFAADGTVALPRLIAEGGGRIVAAHFGTYDYTAACGITAAHQHMLHPACDFAKHVMQVALAGTGIWLSDGATNMMPIGAREVVHRAWRLHAAHVRHSLVNGFYQGWDLHPAQLPTRYAAVYAFFLEGLDAASERLRNSSRRRRRRHSSATCSTMRQPGRGC